MSTLLKSCVSQYKMNENAASAAVADFKGVNAGTFTDATGNPFTNQHDTPGVITGTGALLFDGVDDHVSIGTMGHFAAFQQSAISYWMKSSTTTVMYIFGTINDGTTTAIQIGLNSNIAGANVLGNIRLNIRDNDENLLRCGVESNTKITDGNYHFLVINIDRVNNAVDFYVDGVKFTTTYLFQQTPDNITAFQYPMVIGAQNSRGTVSVFYTGVIDIVAFYNRELTLQEIISLYNGGNGTQALYSLGDEGSVYGLNGQGSLYNKNGKVSLFGE